MQERSSPPTSKVTLTGEPKETPVVSMTIARSPSGVLMTPSGSEVNVPAEAVHLKVSEGEGPAPPTFALNVAGVPTIVVSGHVTAMVGHSLQITALPGG